MRSLRKCLMDASTSLMSFADNQSALSTAEAFGQAEPLTRRLAHILQLYPEVRGLLVLAVWRTHTRS